eukprot:gb/GECH01012666.1/.p1 GENE.gb/GECH01012666.1/~~gb/GECH01012666.1/.p1  ORF type:complete len:123 (+),score=36.93 gb/GECH01012666.1/:1-369(+)
MRLIGHNMLGCLQCGNYPFKLEIEEQQEKKQEPKLEFLSRFIEKLDWNGLKNAVSDCGLNELPEEKPEKLEKNEELLQILHHLLFEVDIISGKLNCCECGASFVIRDGIPHVILREDQVPTQ